MLVDNIMVSGLRQLDLYNLNLTGSLQTNCSLGSFSLRLVDVNVNASRTGFLIEKCDRLVINVVRSTFTSTLLQFTSYVITDVMFMDSSFVGLVDTGARNGGLLAIMPKRQGKHI